MKYILFIGLSLLGFHLPIAYSGRGYTVSKKERTADKVLLKASKAIERKTGVKCIGTGGGMMYEVHTLALSFQHKGDLDIASAREKIVQAGEIFLEEINSCEELKKYLKTYPFTPNNIEFYIWFKLQDQNSDTKGKVRFVHCGDGILSYYTYQPGVYPKTPFFEETYDEAKLRIDSENKKELNLQSSR